jgi:hypothetical protein
MNLSPDPRQLKTKVTLSIINAPESGFFSGEYSASFATKSQDNLNVLNYDFEPTYTYENGTTESKYSSRLKVLSSLQNARIPEVNTAISASSCTFAFGAIVPGEVDPVLDRLKGPIQGYNPIFLDSTKFNSVTSQLDDFTDNTQHLPKIPFSGLGNVLTTYNIWNLVNGTEESYKYIGPKISGKNTGTLRTVKDPNFGAQVELTSEKTNTIIKRIFPTAYDAIYQAGAEIYNPDDSLPQPILARGVNGNNGFHINFSASNMQPNSSAIRIIIKPQIANKDFINDFFIEFKIDSKPVLKILDPYTGQYFTQTDLVAPVLDKNNMNSYDLYVHFVGPNLLVGFSPDITRWNTVINFSGREFYCPPETDVFISLSNTNLKFRYSAIIFNNFNNNQPVNRKKNYITAEFRYSKKKVVDLEKFLNNAVKPSFEASSYRINASPQNTGYNTTNPIDKNISYFADLRLPEKIGKDNFPQFEKISEFYQPFAKSADPDKQTVLFKLYFNTTIEGPAFLQIEVPHPGVLAADPVNNGVADFSKGNSGSTNYTFEEPKLNQLFFDVGDITSWVEGWAINCSAQLTNLSKIEKTATITLKNIDSTEGQKFIDAIENNLISVAIDAGYVQGALYPFFQGFIKSTSYSRKGNDSTFTLSCQDIATFVLSNLYFDKNMMIAGMRHDLAIDSIIACSGFWSYYKRDNTDINGGSISGIDLRLNSNSTNNQDLVKLNPLDKIYDKLGKLLERLNNPYSLPTFRWAERYGFKLECRNNYVDNDLKFTGLTSAGTGYSFDSNAANTTKFMANFQSDLHGLLVNDYTIETNVQSLAAGVRVFGTAMTGFLADERYSQNSVSLNSALYQSRKDLLAYLSNAPRNSGQAPYIGFKKYLMWATQKNEIPDQQVLKRITDSIEIVSKTPISSISFQCYVVKPLNFHGKFLINVFQGQIINSTDQYVYTGVDYNYDKANNLITASVRGTNMPISLGGA